MIRKGQLQDGSKGDVRGQVTFIAQLFGVVAETEHVKAFILILSSFNFLQHNPRYGTVIIDLERHEILDLLPDREAESVQNWLATHPEIEVVSRDRGGAYADGAARGAPQAEQVADRWHLCVRRIGAYSIPFGERKG